jgi:hypothetical protein
MESEQIAAILLRELWWHYDHGGHSGRSWEAQLLETTLHYRVELLDGVPNDVRAAQFLEPKVMFPRPSEQGRLFLEVRHANDIEALKIVLWGLRAFYARQSDASLVESELVRYAAGYVGLPEDGGSYRISYEQNDVWDLIYELRRRNPPPPEY